MIDAVSVLLDENVEHVAGYRLENYGHDVVHVDVVPDLGKGTDDQSIAAYTHDEERVLVTYDDDFVLSLAEDGFLAVLYFPDASLPVETVADLVDEVSTHYPQNELDGVAYVGTEWLLVRSEQVVAARAATARPEVPRAVARREWNERLG